jgi:putative cell wall-binding protein
MTSPRRALALPLIATLALTGALVPTSASAATTTVTIAPDDVAEYRYLDYEEVSVARTSLFLQVDLAGELADLDIDQQLQYYVDNGVEQLEGAAALSGTLLTVPLSTGSRPAGTQYSVGIYSAAANPDLLNIIVPVRSIDFVSGSTTASVDLDAIGVAERYSDWIIDGPVGFTDIVPGDQIVLDAWPGFWTAGPDGTWSGGTFGGSSVLGADPRASLPMDGILNGDASELTFTIQRSHWHFTPNRGLSLSVERTWDNGSQGGGIYFSMPVRMDDPAPTPVVTRISGADRFAVAADIAREAFPSGAAVVYITNGLNYPDALSAAPAAAEANAPLLLATPTALPAATAAALDDLNTTEVVIVGGVNSISPAVVSQIEAITGADSTRRLDGADRFAASRAITRDAFEAGNTPVAYLATGFNFPDALSAGAAAGAITAPVILVNGIAPALDSDTLQLLGDLGVSEVRIAGGPNSVSDGIRTQLSGLGYGVVRLSGADRFEASSNIGRNGFVQTNRVFIATGFNFPDALAGAAWAASLDAPLITVPGTCIPQRVLDDLRGYRVTEITILGGPNSVSTSAQALAPCSGYAWPEF